MLVCDLCRKATPNEGDGVGHHEIEVDGKRVEVDACEGCWTRTEKALDRVLEAGRRVKKKAPRKRRSPKRDDDPVEA